MSFPEVGIPILGNATPEEIILYWRDLQWSSNDKPDQEFRVKVYLSKFGKGNQRIHIDLIHSPVMLPLNSRLSEKQFCAVIIRAIEDKCHKPVVAFLLKKTLSMPGYQNIL